MSLNDLSRILGYPFKDTSLLKQALTHRSLKAAHNERLEFLGDAILGSVIANALFKQYPDASEGRLSCMRANLVCQDSLVALAAELELMSYIRIGASERGQSVNKRPALLADAVEAIIGAIYLDGGWVPCEACVLNWYKDRLKGVKHLGPTRDAKTTLQEYLQARGCFPPVYELVSRTGSPHEPSFTVNCVVSYKGSSAVTGSGSGKSRREAERKAASQSLALLKQTNHASSPTQLADALLASH